MTRSCLRVFIPILLLCLVGASLNAATIEVVNTNDNGAGSLRQAVADASTGDTITFNMSANGNIILATELFISMDLVILGNGQNNTVIDGNNSTRILRTCCGANVQLWQLTIQNGNSNNSDGGCISNGATVIAGNVTVKNGNAGTGSGGCIRNNGTFEATNVVIQGGSAGDGFAGGGVNNTGTFTATNCTISNNATTGTFTSGGGVFNMGMFTATNVTISQNTSTYNAGGIWNNGTFSATNVVITGNSVNTTASSGDGGGVVNSIGGNFIATNVLISGNSVVGSAFGSGGGIFTFSLATLDLTNVTISGNRAAGGQDSRGGGLYVLSQGDNTIANTLIWGNAAATSPDVYEQSAGALGNVINSSIGINPLFVAPQPAGNAPTTAGNYQLLPTSPAIDAGNNAENSEPLDLVGNFRILDGDANTTYVIDQGAYEYDNPASCPPVNVSYLVTSPADAGAGTLRDLVANACPGDTIKFSSGINGIPIVLTGSEITLDKDLVIIGNGQTETIIDGNGNDRIFTIATGSACTLTGVTITNGSAFIGGGITNRGMFTAINIVVSDCSAVFGGGGIYNVVGACTATNVVISGNSAIENGGGITNDAIFTATNVVISGNMSDVGGGLLNNGTFEAINVVISGNAATVGGGVANGNDFTAKNSIIWANSAGTDPEITSLSGMEVYEHTLIKDLDLIPTGPGNFDGTDPGNDPLFVAPELPASAPTTTGDYRLQPISPLRNGGDNNANMELLDLDDNPRIFAGLIDLGPYEIQAGNVEAVCKEDTFYLDENGVAVIIADSLDGGSMADLEIDTLFTIPDTLRCDSVGVRMVDLIVEDVIGIRDTCTAMVTILDTIKPTLVCTEVTITLDGNGLAVIDSNYADNGSFDNCGIDSISLSQTMYTCLDLYRTDSIIMTVVDVNGNTDTCEVGILVIGTDDDNDGYFAECEDCNDNDPNINPGALEICGDNIDNNCDGVIDDVTSNGYCCATGTNPNAYIDQVALSYPFGNIVRLEQSGLDTSGYGNYTAPPGNIESEYVPFVYFSVTPGLNRFSFIRIWVDWNQNGDFDPYEMMVQNITNTTWNGQISVPFMLRNVPGEYTARIGLSQRGYIHDPCDEASRGEFEDYIICIADGCGEGDDNPPNEPPAQLTMNNDQLTIEDDRIFNLQSSINIHVRPNPFVDNLILETMLPNTGEMRVTILNQQGQTISTRLVQGSKGFNQLELETFSLAAGMYYIRVQSGDDVIVKRVVKQ